MKKVITHLGICHIISGTSSVNGVPTSVHTACGNYIACETQDDIQSAGKQAPTCPDCLRYHFANLKTNYSLEKKNKGLGEDLDTALSGMSNLVHAQKAEYGSGGTRSSNESNEGSYPFIPLETRYLFYQLKYLKSYLFNEPRWSGYQNNRSKFLDAGCGCGNVILMANMHLLCSYQHGIEFFPETADKAENWLGTHRYKNEVQFKIIRKDIMKFRGYKDYDVIYFYCPFDDNRLQITFEERLENSMKVGAVLIANLKKGGRIRNDKRLERIDTGYEEGQMFIKIKDGHRKMSESDQYRGPKSTRTKRIAAKYNL